MLRVNYPSTNTLRAVLVFRNRIPEIGEHGLNERCIFHPEAVLVAHQIEMGCSREKDGLVSASKTMG